MPRFRWLEATAAPALATVSIGDRLVRVSAGLVRPGEPFDVDVAPVALIEERSGSIWPWWVCDGGEAHMVGGFDHEVLRQVMDSREGQIVRDLRSRDAWVRITPDALRTWAAGRTLRNGLNVGPRRPRLR